MTRLVLRSGARTHPGRRRAVNQDACLALDEIFAVADGMGGHEGGEIASAIAVDKLRDAASLSRLSRQGVLTAIRSADEQIRNWVLATGGTMGTTITGVAVMASTQGPPRLGVFNVGDSRVYLCRSGQLDQVTHDHSVVQEMIDSGQLTPTEAESHPERHVITRSLGSLDFLDIDWTTLTPRQGDRFLVSSDGLTKEVTDSDLAGVLCSAETADEAAARLLDAALEAGGRDNISVIVIDVLSVAAPLVLVEGDPLDVDTTPRAVDPLDSPTEPHARQPSP